MLVLSMEMLVNGTQVTMLRTTVLVTECGSDKLVESV